MNQFHGLFVNIFHFLKAIFFCKIDLFDFTSFVDLDFFKKNIEPPMCPSFLVIFRKMNFILIISYFLQA